jgi:hypothetical protein
MKTQEQIKTALENGQTCIEDLSYETGNVIEWRLDSGARHHNEHGGDALFSWPFIEEARTSDYLAKHLFARQGFFGELKIK